MGQKPYKSTASSDTVYHQQPNWSIIKGIASYGVPKSKTTMKWEFIECIDVSKYDNDAKECLLHIMSQPMYDVSHFVHTMYYHLCLDVDIDPETHRFVIDFLDKEKLKPTPSLSSVCESYFEATKLIEIRRFCMY